MISFFYNLLLLGRTVAAGFRNDPEFRTIAVLLIFLLLGGAIFFHQVQGWPLLDSLYFCVMTVSTIGYGDLAPTTAVSKIFTMAYAILGIGLFASFVGKLVALRMDHHKKRKENRPSSR